MGRLLGAVAHNPRMLGIGIDEDTAALFDHNDTLEVVGRNSVTVVDGSAMYSDVFAVKGHAGITISGAVLHVLTPGRRFSLKSRSLLDR